MWHLNTPWYDPIIRAITLFVFLFIITRPFNKRALTKLMSYDFLFLIIIGINLQSMIVGSNFTYFSYLIIIITLILLKLIVSELTHHFKWLEHLVEGQPKVLVLNGKIHKRVMKKEKVSDAELFEALREHEIMKSEDVKCAILESDGRISVIRYAH